MLRACLLLLVLIAVCDLGHPLADASNASEIIADVGDATATDGAADVAAEPITGCDWAGQEWVLEDCAGSTFPFTFVVGVQCAVQIISAEPRFIGGWGVVYDVGVALFLPAINVICQGAFDGATIRGVCGMGSGFCAFEAALQAGR